MKYLRIEAPNSISLVVGADPLPGPHDVIVQSNFVGLCRTDLEILRGELEPGWVTYPCVPGHEWSGVIAQIGVEVRDLNIGDPVVCEGRVPCNQCARCFEGATNLCTEYDQLGSTRHGGTAELVRVPDFLVHRLPRSANLSAAVLIEPASSIVRGLERANLRSGESVGIIGIGTLGACGILVTKLRSPRRLVAYGVRDAELEFARRLGATECINVASTKDEPGSKIDEQESLDVVIETAGSPSAVALATRIARPGGRVILLGLAGAGRTLEIPSDRLPNKDLTILGSASYNRAAWAATVQLVADGLLDLSPILGQQFEMSKFGDAFSALDKGSSVGKLVLAHDL